MTRKSKKGEAPAQKPEVTIVMDKELYTLLKEGATTQVLTWKDFTDRPATIGITTPEEDDTLVLRVKHMDTVGFGYLPEGYPERFHARRKTTRFHVELLGTSGAESEIATESSE